MVKSKGARLKDKVAIITGAATGIGRTSARLFAEEGARVVIGDINDKDGEETTKGIKAQGNDAIFVHTDVTSVSDMEKLVKTAVKTYGRLDIFWHNAGIPSGGYIDLITEEDFDKVMATNLKGALFGTKFAIRELRKAGGGSVLFTSSMVGLRPSPYEPTYPLAYELSKASLITLARYLTEPLAIDNIRVNCICPSTVGTPYFDKLVLEAAELEGITREEVLKRRVSRIPLKRVLSMDEVADVAVFLVSDKAAAITGVALAVDGGFSAL